MLIGEETMAFLLWVYSAVKVVIDFLNLSVGWGSGTAEFPYLITVSMPSLLLSCIN